MARRGRTKFLAALAVLSLASGAYAADDADKIDYQKETLSGNWGGTRDALRTQGLTFTLIDINEIFGVLSGGLRRAGSYAGRSEFTVEDRFDAYGWKGASAHATVYQLRNSGRNIGQNVGAISDPSNIDALGTTRLFTLWFQQKWWDDRLSLRIGQLAADDEFVTSETASGLINSTFGWPDLHGANILGGGPAFPLATPGARLAYKPSENLTLQGAVFSGNPAGNCNDLPQSCNRYGTTFSFSGGAFVIGEVQYAINQGKDAAGLPGTYKLGAWYANGNYNDLHYGLGASGVVSLGVDPTAQPLARSGNHGLYAVADQMIWRGKERSINLFVRGGFVPPDRNLVSAYIDAGAGFKGLFGRADDVLTLGMAYATLSRELPIIDIEAGNVPRDHELLFEASYTIQVRPWWTVQPDLQYIVHPNGGQNPNDPAMRLPDALVAGVRSTVKF